MKNYHLFIFLLAVLGCCAPLFSQLSSVPPLIDLDGQRWSLVQQDTTAPLLADIYTNVTEEISGYALQREDQLLLDDKIVEVYSQGISWGSYIVCTDLASGQTLWRLSSNLATSDKLDIDLNVYLRADGNIEVSGMRLIATNTPILFPIGYAVRKIINPETGQLIERIFTPFSEGGVTSLNSNGQLGRTLPIAEDEAYVVINSFPTDDGQYIQLLLGMDAQGVQTDTLGLVSNPLDGSGIEVQQLIDAIKLPNGQFVIGSTSTGNPMDPNETVAELIFLDEQGAFLNRKDISPFVGYSTYFNLDLQADKLLITATSVEGDFNDVANIRQNLLVLDLAGELLLSVPAFSSLAGLAVGNCHLASLPNEEYLLVAAAGNHCLQYFKLDALGEVTRLQTLCQTDTNWRIEPRDLRRTPDGDVLTAATWYQGDTEQFEATVSIDGSVLGLPTSLLAPERAEVLPLEVFPNPSRDRVSIRLDASDTGVLRILNMAGQQLRSYHLANQTHLELSIADLPDGLYQFQWLSPKGNKVASVLRSN